ncbi:MAG TPA: cbb3-type cytochrome c oxidase subunit I [Gemmatimonadaceae bacterium]|jgi:cytochrome c oxidase cbb3-type subunit 1|nr:cbb3-type cytochrome c oxidase subunit I [Gemmatimonadaceae bacterium]
MDWYARAFVKASLAWLAAGVTLGVGMAVHPAWIVYRPAHVHMNLLGFVTMMIYGVAFHVIPRFTGHPVHSPRLALAQWWLANVGLLVFAGGFLVRPGAETAGTAMVALGGTLSALAAYAFVYNIWRTIDGARRAAPLHAVQARSTRAG